MTKEARPAKSVRATPDEWAEIDKAAEAAGMTRSDFLLDSTLQRTRGTLVEKPGRAKGKPAATKPPADPNRPRFVRATSLGGPPRPVKPLPERRGRA